MKFSKSSEFFKEEKLKHVLDTCFLLNEMLQKNTENLINKENRNISDIESVVGRATPLYDALQMKDVGMQSHYEEILRQRNTSGRSSYEGRKKMNKWF